MTWKGLKSHRWRLHRAETFELLLQISQKLKIICFRMKQYIIMYVVIMNLYVILNLISYHFILGHNLWYLVFLISEWVLIKTESCHSLVVYACVCVRLVSCVGMYVFSSIIELFRMFNFLYDIFNECNFFSFCWFTKLRPMWNMHYPHIGELQLLHFLYLQLSLFSKRAKRAKLTISRVQLRFQIYMYTSDILVMCLSTNGERA